MVESGGGAGVSEPLPGTKTTSSYESSGGRVRFTVEIRPGETTVISWTKLFKEATSSKPKGIGSSVSFPSSEAHHQRPIFHPLTSVMAPFKNVAQSEVKDSHSRAGPNRLSNVIQKIEHIYAGSGSSEEEDAFLNDVLNDDEYDTDDSFIDDTELDDYFQVDNSALKHDGFFVNRGELEHIEPNAITDQQPKKRRREDAIKRQNGDNGVHDPNIQTKIGYRLKKSMERNSNCLSHRVTAPSMLTVEVPYDPSISHATEISKKTTADTKVAMNPSGLSSGEGMRQSMDTDQQRTGILTSHDHNSKLNEDYELQEPSVQGSNDKSLPMSGSQGGTVGKFGLNAPPGVNITREPEKVPFMPRKDGSKVRSRSSMLDKAIRELEKIVAEAGPPSMAVHDPGNSSQTVKRRLPQDVKQKLAKVARLAVFKNL